MHLLSLSDELLLTIFEQLNDNQARPLLSNKSPSALASLNLVCRRLNTLAEPYLYKHLRVSFFSVTRSQAEDKRTNFDRLLDVLIARPHRYTYVESLDIWWHQTFQEGPKFDSLLTLLSESSNVKTIALSGYDGNESLDASLFESTFAEKIHSLEVGTFVVERFMKFDALRNIRKLSIGTSIKGGVENNEDADDWWRDYEIPPDRRGTSALEHLDITSWECHPCAVIPILLWAKALKSFTYQFEADSNYFVADDFSHTQMQDILDIHSATLEVINLSTYSAPGTPNFRHFPNLRELSISFYEFFDSSSKDAAKDLAAPHLEEITVDFNREDQQHFVTAEFGEEHYCWFKDLCRRYRSHVPTGGIKHITLINVNDEEDEGLKFLRDSKELLKSNGIDLTWPDAYEHAASTDEKDDDKDDDTDNDMDRNSDQREGEKRP